MVKTQMIAEFVAEPATGFLAVDSAVAAPTIPSGPGSVVSIDLDAINVYYQQLWQLHDQLAEAYTQAEATLDAARPDVVLVCTYEIDGVAKAVRIARDLAGEGKHGLLHSLRMAQSMVERNLADLHDSYQAYLDADVGAASQLDQAITALGGS
jgi:hypothetical protein